MAGIRTSKAKPKPKVKAAKANLLDKVLEDLKDSLGKE